MADLTAPEKRAFERLLAMGSGYVLNFSNRTFDEFVSDSTGRDIWDSKYNCGSGWKANRCAVSGERSPTPSSRGYSATFSPTP
jgi:hypothetical protein